MKQHKKGSITEDVDDWLKTGISHCHPEVLLTYLGYLQVQPVVSHGI